MDAPLQLAVLFMTRTQKHRSPHRLRHAPARVRRCTAGAGGLLDMNLRELEAIFPLREMNPERRRGLPGLLRSTGAGRGMNFPGRRRSVRGLGMNLPELRRHLQERRRRLAELRRHLAELRRKLPERRSALAALEIHLPERWSTLAALENRLQPSGRARAGDRKSTRLNSSHHAISRMPSSA